ncbi:MAG: hypothetical protein QXI02_02395 [Candidatus Caldarchaeum sp.]
MASGKALSATVVFLLLMSVQAQETGVQAVREALRSDLAYARGLVEDDGRVSRAFDPSGSLRGHVLVGSMVAMIHAGLGDPESLALLNRLADSINSRVESEDGLDLGFEAGTLPDADNYLTHVLTADFLSAHYGLTMNARSRENVLKVAESLEQRLGWTPALSKAAYLTLSSRVSYLSGSKPPAADVETALNDFSDHIMDLVSFSARGVEGLTTSLYQLSLLLDAAAKAGLTAPKELVALWAVHVDYVVNASESVPITPENYPRLLGALTSLTYAAEVRGFANSSLAAEHALRLAGRVSAMWRSGGRILLLPVNVFDVYQFDPVVPVGEMVAEVQRGVRPVMADLRFPTLLLVLERSAGLTPELKEAVSLAVGKVAVVDGYFPLVDKGVVKSEEFVNRWWRVSLLSTYLAFMRAPAVLQRNATAEIFFDTHPGFLAFLTILLAAAFLRRTGMLRW